MPSMSLSSKIDATMVRSRRPKVSCSAWPSTPAASGLWAPSSTTTGSRATTSIRPGEVTEANAALTDAPGDVNAAPMGKGWFFKLKLSDKSELDGLMDEAAYAAFVKSLG